MVFQVVEDYLSKYFQPAAGGKILGIVEAVLNWFPLLPFRIKNAIDMYQHNTYVSHPTPIV